MFKPYEDTYTVTDNAGMLCCGGHTLEQGGSTMAISEEQHLGHPGHWADNKSGDLKRDWALRRCFYCLECARKFHLIW